MQKVIVFLILSMLLNSPQELAFSKATNVDDKFVAIEKNVFYRLGDTRVSLQILKYGKNKDIVLIGLHDDEITSVKAAKKVLENTGGQLIRIENQRKRYITFSRKGKRFRFDPNRIFTKQGVRATLTEQNVSVTKDAIRSVEGFARFVLKQIPVVHTVIAVHNNEDGGLSVSSYTKGGSQEKNALAVHRNESHDPDNFFFTTDRRLSRSLSAQGYNVVYQHNKKASDDGSLSIHYGRKNKSYINIEAENGNLHMQEKMIKSVVRRLKRG